MLGGMERYKRRRKERKKRGKERKKERKKERMDTWRAEMYEHMSNK